jgi:hypothetical protein
MKPKHLTAIQDRWIAEPCTLDGKPAKVTGFWNDFATIAELDVSGKVCDFSWLAVNRVMLKDGKFKS